MNAISKEDEQLIQKKIDGKLNSEEEIRFERLIIESEKAKKLFMRLSEVHQSIITEANHLPDIDLSNNIMAKVKSMSKQKNKSKIIRFKSSTIISYAAILFLGLIVGSIATYYQTSQEQDLDNKIISGTMVEMPSQTVYSDQNTNIKIQQIETGNYQLTSFAIETKNSLTIEIISDRHQINENNILFPVKNGNFQMMSSAENKLSYSLSGEIILQISSEKAGYNIKILNNKEELYTFISD